MRGAPQDLVLDCLTVAQTEQVQNVCDMSLPHIWQIQPSSSSKVAVDAVMAAVAASGLAEKHISQEMDGDGLS